MGLRAEKFTSATVFGLTALNFDLPFSYRVPTNVRKVYLQGRRGGAVQKVGGGGGRRLGVGMNGGGGVGVFDKEYPS